MVIAVFLHFLAPLLGNVFEGLAALAGGELLAVAATLWSACKFRTRNRTALFVLAFALCTIPLCLTMTLAYNEWGMFGMFLMASALFSAYCVLVAALGFVAVRRTFSGGRFLLGMTLALPCVGGCVALVAGLIPGMSVGWESILPLIIMPLPYLVSLQLYAVFNRACREGLIRALGLDRGTAGPPSREDGPGIGDEEGHGGMAERKMRP